MREKEPTTSENNKDSMNNIFKKIKKYWEFPALIVSISVTIITFLELWEGNQAVLMYAFIVIFVLITLLIFSLIGFGKKNN